MGLLVWEYPMGDASNVSPPAVPGPTPLTVNNLLKSGGVHNFPSGGVGALYARAVPWACVCASTPSPPRGSAPPSLLGDPTAALLKRADGFPRPLHIPARSAPPSPRAPPTSTATSTAAAAWRTPTPRRAPRQPP